MSYWGHLSMNQIAGFIVENTLNLRKQRLNMLLTSKQRKAYTVLELTFDVFLFFAAIT